MTFKELLESKGIEYKDGSSSDEVRICCLFCTSLGEGEDSRFRLGINTKKNTGGCFNCGWSATRYAVQKVLRKIGSSPEQYTEVKNKDKEDFKGSDLPDEFELLKKNKDYWHKRAWKYLIKRSITPEQIKRYNIGLCMSGRFSYRIIIPVLWKGYLKAVVARDFTGQSKAKYLNSRGTKWIWNLKYKPSNPPGHVILSEGAFKSMSIETVLGEVSGALLGHDVTPMMIKQLHKGKYKEITLWTDPLKKNEEDIDRAGIKGFIHCAEKLIEEGFEVFIIWPPAKKQADELTPKEIKRAYKNRKRWSEWLRLKIKKDISFR